MRKILFLCALVLAMGGVFAYRALRTPMVYGTFVGAPQVTPTEVLGNPEAFMHRTIAFQEVIRDQCTAMGCYFFFKAGKEGEEKKLRIELAEIAMHAPKRRNGYPARVEGQIVPYGDTYQLMATAVEFK